MVNPNMSLQDLMEIHEKNQLIIKGAEEALESTIKKGKRYALTIKTLQEKYQSLLMEEVKPITKRLDKIDIKVNNKRNEIVRCSIFKHELEGAIKIMGGRVDDKYSVTIPEDLPMPTEASAIIKDFAAGIATGETKVSPIITEF